MWDKKRLTWLFYPYIVIAALVPLFLVIWHCAVTERELDEHRTAANLEAVARVYSRLLVRDAQPATEEQAASMLRSIGPIPAIRVTVYRPDGALIADTREPPVSAENGELQPEVAVALQGGVGKAVRSTDVPARKMVYVAVGVTVDDKTVAVVRAAGPLDSPHVWSAFTTRTIMLGLLMALVLALPVSAAITRTLRGSLAQMRFAADQYAGGELHYRSGFSEIDELDSVAESMNKMAETLDERLKSIIRQRNDLRAVLRSMTEAVIVIDQDQTVISLNRSAENLFRITLSDAKGRNIREIIRNTDLHRFVSRTLASDVPLEEEIIWRGESDRFLQAHGTTIADTYDVPAGALVVLNDVTRLKQLENIRKDFVANVSHELKTPITSVKGFIETLKDGALDDRETAVRFLDIIERHTNRLNFIIEDLLTLSRLEHQTSKDGIPMEWRSVAKVVEGAVRSCAERAAEKDITIEVDAVNDAQYRINHNLLHQAVVNLVDNAVKYSEPGNTVRVRVAGKDPGFLVQVIDHGCGIPREHLNRIFERFYRVDKARSRREGGTGLGLAIAKHIAVAHEGRITVDSFPGKGSTFSIEVPAE
jgi:two-component system phosphate regulon sensor histidine kinase PhoR